jgi:arsenite/tail-anchored protein-transporting ATPase
MHGRPIMKFLEHPTRNLFFTGKGGVGKTSVACAAAVKLADAGKNVLLVSTDPASNLDEVLGGELINRPTPIPTLPTLFAMNLDPEKSAAAYRERMVGPYRDILPEAVVKSMEEQFSGACTLEIAAFDEFSRLLGDPTATAQFDHIIFDTAPTGHTLRLLTLPSAWDRFMSLNTTGTSCLGPLAGLQAQQQLYQDSVQALSDPAVTTLVLVSRPEASSLREAERTSGELAELGIGNQHLVVNGVFRAADSSDPYAVALERRGVAALEATPELLKRFPQTILPLSARSILGIDALRSFGRGDFVASSDASNDRGEPVDGLPMLSELIDELVAPGHGVILTMGKGGVGKTTVAAAVAVAIAQRGFEVHVSTTDPAAHIAAALNDERLPNLTVSRIDPEAETVRYSEAVLSKAGANLDEQGRALLEEDLRSPCTEEIAVFRAFADAVAAATNKFVVLDTAPTGHTLLLLDAALAYHREVTRQTSEMPEAVKNLLPRLRDPNFARVLIVTLPEATPVHEAAALQRDLRRAGIEPFAWIVNQVLSSLPITDPLMKQRQVDERPYLREVQEVHARRLSIVSWQIESPTGLQGLIRLTQAVLGIGKS